MPTPRDASTRRQVPLLVGGLFLALAAAAIIGFVVLVVPQKSSAPGDAPPSPGGSPVMVTSPPPAGPSAAGGVATTQAPTLTPTPRPGPQSDPGPVANLGPWRISTLSASNTTRPTEGDYAIEEGFVRWTFEFAVRNVTGRLLSAGPYDVAGAETRGFYAVLRSGDGFTYGRPGGREPVGATASGAGIVPPGFEVPATVALDAPISMTNLTLVLVLDPSASGACSEAPCELDVALADLPGEPGRVAYQAGPVTALDGGVAQGPLRVVPTGAELWLSCGMSDRWLMQVDTEVTNTYGYPLWNGGAAVTVFEDSGRSWTLTRSPFNSGPVPPGSSAAIGFQGEVSDFTEYCRDAPSQPRGPFFAILVLPALSDGVQTVADATWAVFSLEEPTLAAPVPPDLVAPTKVPSDSYVRKDILSYVKPLNHGWDDDGNPIPMFKRIVEVQRRVVGPHRIDACVEVTGGTPSPRYLLFNFEDDSYFTPGEWHISSMEIGAGLEDTFPSMATCVSSIAGLPVK